MTQNDLPQFMEIITALSDVYDKKLSGMAVEMYFETLRDFEIDKIKAAAYKILKTKIFNKFPVPAEFIQYLDPLQDIDTRALHVMEVAFDAMEEHGAYTSVQFDDAVLHRVIATYGGWVEFCLSRRECEDADNDRFWRNDFMKLYTRFARMVDPDERTTAFGGIHHSSNWKYIEAGEVSKPSVVMISTQPEPAGTAPKRLAE